MPIDDPSTWVQATGAVKTTFDSVRSAIGILSHLRSLDGGTEQRKKAINAALMTANSKTAIAEAELAEAFGYELCKCEFPPTAMRTVGFFTKPLPGSRPQPPYGYERLTSKLATGGSAGA